MAIKVTKLRVVAGSLLVTQVPASWFQPIVKALNLRERLTPEWFEARHLAYLPPSDANDLRLEAAAGVLNTGLDWAFIGIALTTFVFWLRDQTK